MENNVKTDYKLRRRSIGLIILLFSVIGGSSIGVISNFVLVKSSGNNESIETYLKKSIVPDNPIFLINAWRFQVLFIIFLVLSPLIYFYEKMLLKYERNHFFLRYLKQNNIQLDQNKDIESQLTPQNIRILIQKQKDQNMNNNGNQNLKEQEYLSTTDIKESKRNSNSTINSINTAFSFFDLKSQIKPNNFNLNLINFTILTAVLQIVWQSFRIWGSRSTIQSHAFALTNLHGIFMVPLMYMLKKEVHKWEIMGFASAILGAFFIIVDSSAKRVGQDSSNNFVDFILIFSNFAASLLFALNKTLMRGRIVSHLFILNFITMIGFIILALLFENATFNSDIQRGIFGWFQFPNQFQIIFLLGFCGTFWGSAVGYTIALRFFSPLICMNILLFEPILAQILGVICGIDHIPGLFTVFGVLSILVGVYYANIGANKRQKDTAIAKQEYKKELQLKYLQNDIDLIEQMKEFDFDFDEYQNNFMITYNYLDDDSNQDVQQKKGIADLVIKESIKQFNQKQQVKLDNDKNDQKNLNNGKNLKNEIIKKKLQIGFDELYNLRQSEKQRLAN